MTCSKNEIGDRNENGEARTDIARVARGVGKEELTVRQLKVKATSKCKHVRTLRIKYSGILCSESINLA